MFPVAERTHWFEGKTGSGKVGVYSPYKRKTVMF